MPGGGRNRGRRLGMLSLATEGGFLDVRRAVYCKYVCMRCWEICGEKGNLAMCPSGFAGEKIWDGPTVCQKNNNETELGIGDTHSRETHIARVIRPAFMQKRGSIFLERGRNPDIKDRKDSRINQYRDVNRCQNIFLFWTNIPGISGTKSNLVTFLPTDAIMGLSHRTAREAPPPSFPVFAMP